MKTLKLLMLACMIFMLNQLNAFAETNAVKDIPPNYEEQFIMSRLSDLHEKIQLNANQEKAWGAWSSGVKKDFSEMHEMMEERMAGKSKKHGLMLSTPERLEAYQQFLDHRLALLQEHIEKVKQAAKRTLAFYDVLDSKQKVIFDLYWSNWQANYFSHHPMMGPGYGQGYGYRHMQPPKTPSGAN